MPFQHNLRKPTILTDQATETLIVVTCFLQPCRITLLVGFTSDVTSTYLPFSVCACVSKIDHEITSSYTRYQDVSSKLQASAIRFTFNLQKLYPHVSNTKPLFTCRKLLWSTCLNSSRIYKSAPDITPATKFRLVSICIK